MQSLLNQSLNDIEIIMVDDGSPDGCPAMCDEYARKDNRVKVVHKENGGLGYARNSGLEVATGEYVAFVDSDDFVDTQMYERLHTEAKKNDLDICYCGFSRHYPNGKVKLKKEVDEETLFIGRKEVDSFLLDMVGPPPTYHSDVKYEMSACRAVYRRELIELYDIRFFSERVFVSEDLLFNFDYLSKAERVGFLPEHFYYYCANGAVSLTSTYSRAKYEKYKVFLDEVKRKLSLLFPEKTYINRFHRLCFLYLRIGISQDLNSQGQRIIRDKKRIVMELAGDSYFHDMFAQYPYKQLPWKHRLLFTLLKNKHYGIVASLF